jgi:cation diffusion facilitator family transporter
MDEPPPVAKLQDTPCESAAVRRVTWLGLGANLALAGLKFAAGFAGRSQALVADGVHSVSDSSTDLAILVGVRYWCAPADASHPHGHRRIETLITLAIAVVLAAVAVGLAYDSLASYAEPHKVPPGWIALVAAAVSVLVKEAMYRWTASVGRRARSGALLANAWHHRSDALSSVPVIVAVIGARIEPGWWFLDHVAAVVVAVFILSAAWKIGWPAAKELVDAGAPQKVRAEIERIARSVEPVCHVHAVRTRYVGPGVVVDLHVKVDGALTVREGHDVSEQVKGRLLAEGPDLVDVVVHLEPCDEEPGESRIQSPTSRTSAKLE